MKKKDLIKVARDLDIILGLEPPIDAKADEEVLYGQVKEAALMLEPEDTVREDTVELLKEIEFTDGDFNKAAKDGLDPVPAFLKLGLISEPEPEKKTKSKKKTVEKKKEREVPPKPQEEPEEVEEVEEVEEPSPEPAKDEAPKSEPKHSAYGMAFAIMGAQPTLPLAHLYEVMKQKGYDLVKKGGSIKTAHSICKKYFVYLRDNGYIDESKL